MQLWFVLALLGGFIGAFLVSRVMQAKRRGVVLSDAAMRAGLAFAGEDESFVDEALSHLLLRWGNRKTIKHVLRGSIEGQMVVIFDYECTSSTGPSTRTCVQTVAAIAFTEKRAPEFSLRTVTEAYAQQDKGSGIHFESSEDFAKHYLLEGPDEPAIRELFQLGLVQFLGGQPGWWIEGKGAWLVMCKGAKLVHPAQLQRFVSEIRSISTRFTTAL